MSKNAVVKETPTKLTYKINFVICKHFVMYRVHFIMYSKKIYPKHPTGFGKFISSTVGSITSYMVIYCKF